MTVKERIRLDYIIIYTGAKESTERERERETSLVNKFPLVPLLNNDLIVETCIYRFATISKISLSFFFLQSFQKNEVVSH